MRLTTPLDDIFSTGSHVRVLRALFNLLPKGLSVSGREIARRAGVSNPTAQSVLSSLSDQGLLLITRSLRVTYYRLNSDHVLAPVIADLFAHEDRLLQSLRHDLGRALPQLVDVDAAYIFGSAARGEMRPDSDIDVAVTLKRGTELPDEQDDIDALSRRYGSRINLIELRPRRSRNLRPIVMREGLPIAIAKQTRRRRKPG